jgi:UDP-N-acetylglucosamine kinase
MSLNEEPLANFTEEQFDAAVAMQKFLLSADAKPVETPVAYLLGGQSGAGKSGIHKSARNEVNKNLIVIDGDTFRPYHPHNDLLNKKYGIDAVNYKGEFAGKITEALIGDFSNESYTT